MKYLLDSNAIIALVMDMSEPLVARAGECEEGDIVTSAIALAEVGYGSRNAKPPALDQLQAFMDEVPVLDFDRKAAVAYAQLPFRRGSYDQLIAAHALSLDLVVITDNEEDFANLPGVGVENWTR